jgi:phage tail-like protein
MPGINDLKSALRRLTASGGGKRNDPVGNFKFRLELGSIEVAGFSECTGLQLETKVYEYKEGGRNSHSLKFPDTGSVGNITLKRGITTGANADVLFNWHQDVMDGNFDKEKNPNRRPDNPDKDIEKRCSITLYNDSGSVVMRWNLFRAFPVKWVGPEFKAAASELAIETLELACEGIELKKESN